MGKQMTQSLHFCDENIMIFWHHESKPIVFAAALSFCRRRPCRTCASLSSLRESSDAQSPRVLGTQHIDFSFFAECLAWEHARPSHIYTAKHTYLLLALCRSCCLACLSLGRQSLLGFMRHDSSSVVVAGKTAPHPWPCICQSLATHVLDALSEVALMPLLSVPAKTGCA